MKQESLVVYIGERAWPVK